MHGHVYLNILPTQILYTFTNEKDDFTKKSKENGKIPSQKIF